MAIAVRVWGARVIAAVLSRILQFVDQVASLPNAQLIGALQAVSFPQQIREVYLLPPTDSPNSPDLRCGGRTGARDIAAAVSDVGAGVAVGLGMIDGRSMKTRSMKTRSMKTRSRGHGRSEPSAMDNRANADFMNWSGGMMKLGLVLVLIGMLVAIAA